MLEHRTAASTSSLALFAVLALCASGCPAPQVADAGDATQPDASSADIGNDEPGDTATDVPPDGPPPLPGSIEGMIREACNGRPPSTAAVTLSYASGEPMGRLQNTAPGDLEGLHLIATEPTMITRLRVNLRGGAGGSVLVRLTDDYGRSQPDVSHDLMEPVTVDFTANGWIDVPLATPVPLHPDRHAWILVEHLTEPLGLSVGTSTAPGRLSMAHVQSIIDRLRAMGEQFFEWVPRGQTTDYLAQAIGTSVCGPRARPLFTDVSTAAGLPMMVGSSNWADVDGDGWDDAIGVATPAMMPARPFVSRNRHDGTFEPYNAQLGLEMVNGNDATYADFNGDGRLDLFAGDYQDGLGPFPTTRGSRIWLQGADHRFTVVDATLEAPGPTAASAAGDCDGDGTLDLFIGQWLRQYPMNAAPDFVFRGRGDGTFEDISHASGLPMRSDGKPTYGVNFADYDNDGDSDIFVANYGGRDNDLWRNDGQCHLTNAARATGVFSDAVGQAGTSFGFEFGDYDNDGDLDAFETNIGHPRYDGLGTDHSRLLRNGGAPGFGFIDARETSGIAYVEGDIASAWGDYDNDGDLDIYVASTYPWQFSRLYRQESDHTFIDVTYLGGVGTEINGRAAWYDYDRDGDLDLFTSPGGRQVLFRNELRNANHWLQIRLHTTTGRNTDAIGARITVDLEGGVHLLRDVSAGRTTYGSQSPFLQHFGLGASGAAVRVHVRWPDGMSTDYDGVAADRIYMIRQGDAPQPVM